MANSRVLPFEIQAQPDETSCGPTSLQAIYNHFGVQKTVKQMMKEIVSLETGGTLGVFLGLHALSQGFKVTLCTYNLKVFDPTWFTTPGVVLAEKLKAQCNIKNDKKLLMATRGYLSFLAGGGNIIQTDLSPTLLQGYLDRGLPILVGLSSTSLYKSARERGKEGIPDDIAGEPAGHYVVLYGYDGDSNQVMVADPYGTHQGSELLYSIDMQRVINAILLGTFTYDANFLIIEPSDSQ